jgi:DNA-binding CsgD family transcriptional regulator
VSITLRELEVADLVAEGLSNPAIAAALCVSPRTVAAHLTHILTKLDLANRVQVAVWAATRQSAKNNVTSSHIVSAASPQTPRPGSSIPARDKAGPWSSSSPAGAADAV